MAQQLKILLLQGDGIGPEIVAATRQILEAVNTRFALNLVFETADIGFAALEKHGTTFPESVLEKAREADGVVLGPVSHNDYPPANEGGLNPSGELRKQLDLYTNIRPARAVAGIQPLCGKAIDLIIVRENTEGFYADRSMHLGHGEFMPTPDLALSMRKVSRHASMRICKQAFELAQQRNKKITVVHKANVLRVSDGLFLECARQVSQDYPEVEYQEQLIDAMAALLVRDSSVFDVIVTTNMYGDILSDLASEIAGGLGMAGSLNYGGVHAVAQAQHGSAPTIAGQDIANPTSLIASCAMLLEWLSKKHSIAEFETASKAIDSALLVTLEDARTHTIDLGGELGTHAFTQAVLNNLNSNI